MINKYEDQITRRFKDKILYYMSREICSPLIGPDIIQIAITHRCNLRCKFCDVVKDAYKPEEELSTDTIKSIIDQFKEMGGKKVFLVGGEPFIRKDFFEVMDYANKKRMLSLVSTNGSLIDEKMAKKIVDLPLGIVMISLEGPNAELHDSLRGEKVFERAVKGIRLIQEYKKKKGLGKKDYPLLAVLSVVLNSNLEHLADIVRFTEQIGVSWINFQPLQTNNTIMWEKDTTNKEWVPEERYPVLDKTLDNLKAYKKKASIRVRCDFDNIKKYFRCDVKEPDVKCFQNYLRVVIKPNGKLWTCARYHDSIYNKGLKELWYSDEMKKDRIAARRCKSMCLQRCMYLEDAKKMKEIVEKYISDIDCMEKEKQKKLIQNAIEIINSLYRKVIIKMDILPNNIIDKKTFIDDKNWAVNLLKDRKMHLA